MSRPRRRRLRALADEVARLHPELADPRGAIVRGDVIVDGIARSNPASLVRPGASITIRRERRLRGETKLRAALSAFGLSVRDRIALDVGAAAGGFTRALLDAGAAKVYAVDAGHGQLLGSLRQDPRVVNLESTNLGALDRMIVRDVIDVVTIDLSYLSLRDAVPQLERVSLAPDADAVALVKPQFELGLAQPPSDSGDLAAAVRSAEAAFARLQWRVQAVTESSVRGAGGSVEFLVHARRRA